MGDDVIDELDRRRNTLVVEIQTWMDVAANSPGTLGLHKRQLHEIRRALEHVMEARKGLVDAVAQAASPTEIADAYIEALDEIVGAGELWRIYQAGIEQHSISAFKDFVHEATLIASSLVDAVFAAEPPASVPAPAMVYLDPAFSPAAGGRLTAAGDSGFVVRRFRALNLPVPLVLVPADQARSFWSLTQLAHEVGHNLDQELGRATGMRLSRALRTAIVDALNAADAARRQADPTVKIDGDRIRRWSRWADELLADVFGLSLGGPAFASSVSSLLLPLAAATRFATLDGDAEGQSTAPHPPPVLRQRVLLAMMHLAGTPAMTSMATVVRAEWANVVEPAYLATLVPDVEIVAKILWDFPAKPGRPALRSLAPFSPDPRFDALVAHLVGTSSSRPSPTLPDAFPRAQVAFAAELARRAGGDPDQITARAISFAKGIPSVPFAAAAADPIKERAQMIRFAREEEEA